jgi:hypothetical protein
MVWLRGQSFEQIGFQGCKLKLAARAQTAERLEIDHISGDCNPARWTRIGREPGCALDHSVNP